MSHPRLLARGTRTNPQAPEWSLAAVYALDERRRKWAMSELERIGARAIAFAKLSDVLALLSNPLQRRPQILIADFDCLDAGEVFAIAELRERGWFGSIIGLGAISQRLVASLPVDRVLAPPFYDNLLCEAVKSLGLMNVTTPIPILTE